MSKKRRPTESGFNKPDDKNNNRKSLTQFEDEPYWEKLRKSEADYESKMKDYTSTRGLSQRRPPREPIEPELFNQIMETINRRKSQIEEYKKENQSPQIEIPRDFAKIQEVKTDYKKGREDYNMFVDDYVDRQKAKYKRARMADQFVEDIDRYEELLKTGIYEEAQGVELEDEHGEVVLIPARHKGPAIQKSKTPVDYKQRKKALEYIPAVTLEIPDSASKPVSRGGTQMDLVRKDGTLQTARVKRKVDMSTLDIRGSRSSFKINKYLSKNESRSGIESDRTSDAWSIGSSESLMRSVSATSLSSQAIHETEKPNATQVKAPDIVMKRHTSKPAVKSDSSSSILKTNKKKTTSNEDTSEMLNETLTLKEDFSGNINISTFPDGKSLNSSFFNELFTNKISTKTLNISGRRSDVFETYSSPNEKKKLEVTQKRNISHNKESCNENIVCLPGKEVDISEEEFFSPCQQENNFRRSLRPILGRTRLNERRVKASVKSVDFQTFLTVLPLTVGQRAN